MKCNNVILFFIVVNDIYRNIELLILLIIEIVM